MLDYRLIMKYRKFKTSANWCCGGSSWDPVLPMGLPTKKTYARLTLPDTAYIIVDISRSMHWICDSYSFRRLPMGFGATAACHGARRTVRASLGSRSNSFNTNSSSSTR